MASPETSGGGEAPQQQNPDLSPPSSSSRPEEEDLRSLQASFRRQGWNLAGANLLAAACLVAQRLFLYVRPRLVALDAACVLIVTFVGASLFVVGGSTEAFLPLVGAGAGMAGGGLYLLWKVRFFYSILEFEEI